MHAKTIIIDQCVVLTGSVNMTQNGHGNNKEHLLSVRDPSTVTEFNADFEYCWQLSTPVTPDLVEKMLKRSQERYDSWKGSNRSKSREPSVERKVSRSLTNELQQAEQPEPQPAQSSAST